MNFEYDTLKDVKDALKITGTFHDNALNVYINDIRRYLLGAGIKHALVDSEVCSGVIARGVADIWHNGSNDGKLSEYFYDAVAQLAYSNINYLESYGEVKNGDL